MQNIRNNKNNKQTLKVVKKVKHAKNIVTIKTSFWHKQIHVIFINLTIVKLLRMIASIFIQCNASIIEIYNYQN